MYLGNSTSMVTLPFFPWCKPKWSRNEFNNESSPWDDFLVHGVNMLFGRQIPCASLFYILKFSQSLKGEKRKPPKFHPTFKIFFHCATNKWALKGKFSQKIIKPTVPSLFDDFKNKCNREHFVFEDWMHYKELQPLWLMVLVGVMLK
jgi:hypothetical protein